MKKTKQQLFEIVNKQDVVEFDGIEDGKIFYTNSDITLAGLINENTTLSTEETIENVINNLEEVQIDIFQTFDIE